MASQSIMISGTHEYDQFVKGIAALLEVDFKSPIVDLDGKFSDFSAIVVVVVILTEGYRRKEQLQQIKDDKIPMIFVRHSDFLPDTWYSQLAVHNGKQHYFDNQNPSAGSTFSIGKFLTEVHSKVPPTSSARKDFKKRILLVGEAGVGKSTLTSLLINQSVSEGMNPGGILVAPALQEGTAHAMTHSNGEYIVTDTMGFGFPRGDSNTIDAVINLYETLRQTRRGYHAVFFLIADKRRLKDTRTTFDMYYHTIFPDMANYFRVIYTNSEFEMDYLDSNPDPLERNVKGVCIGCNTDEPVYALTRARTLEVITELPELGWMSRNSFINTFKGMAHKLNISFLDDDAEKLAREWDKVLKNKR